MAVSAAGAVTAFVAAYIIAIASTLCFGWLRNLSSVRRFYAPRRFDTNTIHKPPRLPSGWLLWIWHLLRIPEDQIIAVAGLDSAVYLRVLRMSWEIFVWVGIWCLAVVLPVNLSGDRVQEILRAPPPPSQAPDSSPSIRRLLPPAFPPKAPYAPQAPEPPGASYIECYSIRPRVHAYDVSDLDKCSLTNIEDRSYLLWVHVFSAYVVTCIVIRFLLQNNHEMMKLRIIFLANSPKGGPSHTVLVQDIPGIKYGTVPWTFRQMLNGAFFRALPMSWRVRMAEVVDDIFFRGLSYALKKAMKRMRRTAKGVPFEGHNSVPPAPIGYPGGTEEESHQFSYSQHVQKFASVSSRIRSGSQMDLGDGPVSPNSTGNSDSKPPSFLASGLAHASPPPGGSSNAEKTEEQSEEAEGGEENADIQAYVARFNVELDAEMDRFKVATISNAALDVWAIATDFLQRPPKPGQPTPSLRDMVEAEFKYVYGKSGIAVVNPVWDQSELDPLINKFNRVRTQLEDYLDWAAFQIRRRKKLTPKMIRIIPMMYGSWGAKNFGVRPVNVEALPFWIMRLRHLEAEIEEAKARAQGVRVTPSAFVTFHSRIAQAVAASTLHQHVESMWHVVPAPAPKEVLWFNIKMRAWERALRRMVHWAGFTLLLCFYMVPITAVQGLIALPDFYPKYTRRYSNSSAMTSMLQSIMPGICLRLVLLPLSWILALLCRYTGFISRSSVDLAVVVRYSFVLGVVVFMGSLISGSVLNQLQDVLENPTAIIKMMAISVPQTASFFIGYTLVAGLALNSVAFLRVIKLALFLLRSQIVSTPRQRARLWANRYASYSHNLPQQLLVFLIGIVFCIINPIMCIAAISYFSFTLVYEQYELLYICTRRYETGGLVWGIVFHLIMIALYTMQVILTVIMSLKSFSLAAIIAPLLLFTAIFHVASIAVFKRPWTELSLHDASYLDYQDRKSRENHDKELTEAEKAEIRKMYLSPAFKRSAHDIDELLVEAEKVQRISAGEPVNAVVRDLLARGLMEASQDATNEYGDDAVEYSDNDDVVGELSQPGGATVSLQLDRRRAAGNSGSATAAGPAIAEAERVTGPQRQRTLVRFRTDLESGVAAGTTAVFTGTYGTTLTARRALRSDSDGENTDVSHHRHRHHHHYGALASPAAAVAGGARARAGARARQQDGSALAAPPPAAASVGVGPYKALALVSALVDQVATMSGGEREELQALLQTTASAGVGQGSSSSRGGGRSGGGLSAQRLPASGRRSRGR